MPHAPFAVARRRFIQWLGLLFATPALGAARRAFAQPGGAKPAALPPAPPAPPAAPGAGEAPPEISPQARSLAEVVRARYGSHLSDPQLEEVTKDLDRAVKNGERLRQAKLANAAEPDFIFGASLES